VRAQERPPHGGRFFYPAPQESNYFVYIDSVAELKFEALAKQVSRFEGSVHNYRPTGIGKTCRRRPMRCFARRRARADATGGVRLGKGFNQS